MPLRKFNKSDLELLNKYIELESDDKLKNRTFDTSDKSKVFILK